MMLPHESVEECKAPNLPHQFCQDISSSFPNNLMVTELTRAISYYLYPIALPIFISFSSADFIIYNLQQEEFSDSFSLFYEQSSLS